jgi:hypothetical protein
MPDSRPETYAHIQAVQANILAFVSQLLKRSHLHDRSKLEPPELQMFDAHPRLHVIEYDSEEYRAALVKMGPALKHHYAHNSHHPEHYWNGVAGMTLCDLVEMLADWEAAAGGNVRESIAANQARFGYSDDVASILLNTLPLLEFKSTLG